MKPYLQQPKTILLTNGIYKYTFTPQHIRIWRRRLSYSWFAQVAQRLSHKLGRSCTRVKKRSVIDEGNVNCPFYIIQHFNSLSDASRLSRRSWKNILLCQSESLSLSLRTSGNKTLTDSVVVWELESLLLSRTWNCIVNIQIIFKILGEKPHHYTQKSFKLS